MKITVSIDKNRELNFVSIINFLVSYKIMSLDSAIDFYSNFKDGEKITIEVPCTLEKQFTEVLEAGGCCYERLTN